MTLIFDISYLGNVTECRTEAEISLRTVPSGTDPLCAVVYEGDNGSVVEWFGAAKETGSVAGLADAVEDAKLGLSLYVNRRGENPPDGLTRAGLSLWLLEKVDGTALGIPLRSTS